MRGGGRSVKAAARDKDDGRGQCTANYGFSVAEHVQKDCRRKVMLLM